MRKLSCLLIALCACWATASLADTAALLYTRTAIIIHRKQLPPPMPWLGADAPKENPGILFETEVRDAMTLYNQNGWYNLSSPQDRSGLMMMFAKPSIAPITHSAQYAPLDILLIDQEGKIIQIIPNINLSELDQDIMPEKPVLAFLFIRGGSCQRMSIHPGDIVEYKLFKRPPVVLSAPAATPTQVVPEEPAPDAKVESKPQMLLMDK